MFSRHFCITFAQEKGRHCISQQSPVGAVTPTYYQALPAAPPMTHLPPPSEPPLALYCDLVELPTPLLAPPLPPPPPHSHPPHLPPPPQQIKSHTDDHIFLVYTCILCGVFTSLFSRKPYKYMVFVIRGLICTL